MTIINLITIALRTVSGDEFLVTTVWTLVDSVV